LIIILAAFNEEKLIVLEDRLIEKFKRRWRNDNIIIYIVFPGSDNIKRFKIMEG
jgi:hypothetical protein